MAEYRYMARTAWPTTSLLLAHRLVRLHVGVGLGRRMARGSSPRAARFPVVVVRLPAALVHKIPAERQVAPLAGGAVQLHQRQLDFLVAAVAALLAGAGAKDRADVVGVAAGDVQQSALAGGLVVGHGRLDQVAGAVQLVAVAQVGPALVRLDHGVSGC